MYQIRFQKVHNFSVKIIVSGQLNYMSTDIKIILLNYILIKLQVVKKKQKHNLKKKYIYIYLCYVL